MKNARLSAFVLATSIVTACVAKPDGETHSSQPAVALATATYGTYVEQVAAVGRTGAPAGSETKLSFAEDGVLRSIFVRIGDRVSAGEPLAQLDTSGLVLSASQAQADARAAQAAAVQSAVDRTTMRISVDDAALRREETLYAAGIAPLKDVQAARAQLAQDRADVATTRAQISGANAQAQSAQDRAALAERDLSNATLRAPADGTVTGVYKHVGEAVDPTAPVIGIGPDNAQDVTLQLASSDAARVHAGDPVTLFIPGTQLRSRGSIVGVSAAVDPSTQAATVIAHGVPAGAPMGSAVQAAIDIGRDRGVLVPQSAVVQDPQSGNTLVFVQVRDKSGVPRFEERTVRVDHENGTQALIGTGLRPGERIAAQGGFALVAPASGSD